MAVTTVLTFPLSRRFGNPHLFACVNSLFLPGDQTEVVAAAGGIRPTIQRMEHSDSRLEPGLRGFR